MCKINFKYIMENLAQEYGIFCSEADFQFSLAQNLKQIYPDFSLWLEYPYTLKNNHKMYIDIFMTNGEIEYYIELKYKTKKLEYNAYKNAYKYELTLQEQNLKDQAAQSIGALLFHKDINRLEQIIDETKNKMRIGYAVFLTNDSLYYNKETKCTKRKDQQYKNCYFRNGNILSSAEYPNGSCKLKKDYNSNWEEYKHHNKILSDSNSNFQYIVAQIHAKD